MRARADQTRSNVASVFTVAFRIVIVIVVLCLILPAYRFAGTTYFRYRLNTVKEAAMKSCGGPITDTTASYQKTQIDHCLETDDTLIKAQTDYSNFTKTDKSRS